jgi:hypothetical protein
MKTDNAASCFISSGLYSGGYWFKTKPDASSMLQSALAITGIICQLTS